MDSICIFIVELLRSVVWQMGQNIDGTGMGLLRALGAIVRIFLPPEGFSILRFG